MGYVPTAPRQSRSYDRDRRDVDANIRRLDRKRVNPQRKRLLVEVTPEAEEWWPPGTAWLDTSADA